MFVNVICLLSMSLFQQLIKILSGMDEFYFIVRPRAAKLTSFCQPTLWTFFWNTWLTLLWHRLIPESPEDVVLRFLLAHAENKIDSVKFGLALLMSCISVLLSWILKGIWKWSLLCFPVEEEKAMVCIRSQCWHQAYVQPFSDLNQTYKIVQDQKWLEMYEFCWCFFLTVIFKFWCMFFKRPPKEKLQSFNKISFSTYK